MLMTLTGLRHSADWPCAGGQTRSSMNLTAHGSSRSMAARSEASAAGESQQQLQSRLIGFKAIKPAVFEVGPLGFQKIDMMTDPAGDEPMVLAEFPVERGQQLFPWGVQAAGILQGLFRCAALEQAVDHGEGRPAYLGSHPIREHHSA
jgi:hypothetical protein